MKKNNVACPCGSHLAFNACCEPLIKGAKTASSSLELMRSRYVAYTLKDQEYLKKTWINPPHPFTLDPALKWIKLEILHHEDQASTGEVEFIAFYKISGRAQKLHEKSSFLKKDGQWYYQNGLHFDE